MCMVPQLPDHFHRYQTRFLNPPWEAMTSNQMIRHISHIPCFSGKYNAPKMLYCSCCVFGSGCEPFPLSHTSMVGWATNWSNEALLFYWNLSWVICVTLTRLQVPSQLHSTFPSFVEYPELVRYEEFQVNALYLKLTDSRWKGQRASESWAQPRNMETCDGISHITLAYIQTHFHTDTQPNIHAHSHTHTLSHGIVTHSETHKKLSHQHTKTCTNAGRHFTHPYTCSDTQPGTFTCTTRPADMDSCIKTFTGRQIEYESLICSDSGQIVCGMWLCESGATYTE